MRTRTRLLISLCTAAVLLTPSTAAAYFPHTISTGESLYSVAAADGLTVSQLAAANGLSSASQLRAGTTLELVLLTTISTQLPGDAVAHLTTDVYAADGSLALPKGTRLIGSYGNHVGADQPGPLGQGE